MKVLIGIILSLIVLVGLLTYLYDRFFKKSNPNQEEDIPAPTIAADCCGAHEVCEVEALIRNTEEIVYFDDEELDRFKGLGEDAYKEDDLEEIRDVLYTLDGHDEIKMWLISIDRRGIELPSILKQEAYQLITQS